MRHVSAFLLLISLSLNAHIATAAEAMKPFTIGIGTYASTISYDNALLDDVDFTGGALSFGYAISDQFALRATLFSQESTDNSNFESKGFDLLGYLGTGLATHGLKAYIGGGYFSDNWELGPVSERFNGLQLSGGLGYNWDYVSLDFILNLREASDYEVLDINAAAVSGSLLLSYRF
jgi:hypothetical protein